MNTSLSSVEKHRPVAIRCDKPVNSCLHVVFKQESGVNRSSDVCTLYVIYYIVRYPKGYHVGQGSRSF